MPSGPLHRMAASVRRPPAVGEIALFAAAYVTYFGVRALTQGSTSQAVVNAEWLARAERSVGVRWEDGIQSAVLGTQALVKIANWIYVFGHWPVLLVAGALLFRHRREHYYLLRNACLVSGAIGLVIFAAFPVAPPRLAGLGATDTVTLYTGGYRTVLPPSLVNEYAAMPSFHAGWNVVLGIVVFHATTNPVLRVMAIVGPLAMIFAVVATANHFVLDVVVGTAICLAALALVRPTLKPYVPGGSMDGALRRRAPRRQRSGARAPRELSRSAGPGG